MNDTTKKVRAARDIIVGGLFVALVVGGLLFLLGFAVFAALEGQTGVAVFAGAMFVIVALWKLASKRR
ncbi:hypothetical protein B1813_19025 [Saccharomonospora piscinae]|uniref:Uncharacterized protein n=1 Tax=Saccharomonospora piscinae TaxID=687388 RepID=A0A1V8ZZ25_SACPI|nr:hypothetical protein [Saccharomonospora piscinae]OQO89934.1 hypothetical protein B1813_19025 [Saccharomonospora piscinae]